MDASSKSQPRASTIPEFCQRYGIARSTAYELHRRGQLIVTKIGKKSVVLREHEEAWKDALPTLPKAPERPPEERGAKHGNRNTLPAWAAEAPVLKPPAYDHETVNFIVRLAAIFARTPPPNRGGLIKRLDSFIDELAGE
jgi:hypothetical protein